MPGAIKFSPPCQMPATLSRRVNIPTEFVKADLRVKERRHVKFATTQQIEHLSKVRTWYVDSTFKLVRKPFTQLLSVNTFGGQGTAGICYDIGEKEKRL